MIDNYLLIIGIGAVVVLSVLYSWVARRTNVPSVLMLIATGVIASLVLNAYGLELPDLNASMEILGSVGLMLIVLEGALDLKVTKRKIGLITRSALSALAILLITSAGIAFLFKEFWPIDFYQALVYAIPVSVVSSAIVIPSITDLAPAKREFLIYESTFSDIMGIMLFNFVVFGPAIQTGSSVAFSTGVTLVSSAILAIVISYLLIIWMHRLDTRNKFILILGVLVIIFAAGKYFHLPTLVIVLLFGMMMGNEEFFFKGQLQKYREGWQEGKLKKQFDKITEQGSFILRTFFFVLFGLSIRLETILSQEVILVGALVLMIIFSVRYLNLKLISKLSPFPQIMIAPRGLVSILLYFKIPVEIRSAAVSEGVLVFVVVTTSLLMMMGLVIGGHSEEDMARRLEGNLE